MCLDRRRAAGDGAGEVRCAARASSTVHLIATVLCGMLSKPLAYFDSVHAAFDLRDSWARGRQTWLAVKPEEGKRLHVSSRRTHWRGPRAQMGFF